MQLAITMLFVLFKGGACETYTAQWSDFFLNIVNSHMRVVHKTVNRDG